jgi:succinate dehydrogenase/fumarate reductase flavoprotein subunit
MLRRGIDLIKEIRNAPMRAENVHELIRSLEVKSIIDNCELIIRASLERRESRKRPVKFNRADFPEQDDKNYFAFLAFRLEDGEFKFSKIPIKY